LFGLTVNDPTGVVVVWTIVVELVLPTLLVLVSFDSWAKQTTQQTMTRVNIDTQPTIDTQPPHD
jgi:hypothetical protein